MVNTTICSRRVRLKRRRDNKGSSGLELAPGVVRVTRDPAHASGKRALKMRPLCDRSRPNQHHLAAPSPILVPPFLATIVGSQRASGDHKPGSTIPASRDGSWNARRHRTRRRLTAFFGSGSIAIARFDVMRSKKSTEIPLGDHDATSEPEVAEPPLADPGANRELRHADLRGRFYDGQMPLAHVFLATAT